ncbi:MAG: 5-amino-6-(D-ribitylamino)uracil--L-tyrosine 4-hydroxyphenyl transferase CofH, partial [Pseudomonadota bacterium]|nr:5-amino-6-(D-ribitylamino)uracil--L-tyrosine 4-hydroxyphenyl transferase CofH [Pseudomonadota bacterium]
EKTHKLHNHIQEIIVQNFVPKPNTKMHSAPELNFTELLWTIAATRIIFGSKMSIQVPPNLNSGRLKALLGSGINDWGGVSPVTPDHVNPESPWPELEHLRKETELAGYSLVERLTIYPKFIANRSEWLEPKLFKPVLNHADASGLARTDDWSAGNSSSKIKPREFMKIHSTANQRIQSSVEKAVNGDRLDEYEITNLFSARGINFDFICKAANDLRESTVGNTIHYVVNRNINYTNMCTYRCSFCAFSKGKGRNSLRGKSYLLDMDEIARRSIEAWQRGATEVCLQGGIHPSFNGDTYLEICKTIKSAAPNLHIHAFSPLEISHGAHTAGLKISTYLEQLKNAGLGTLPGTAAEILDDSIRELLCANKVTTEEWINVISTAHEVGLKTTSTIMFGHIETPDSWAKHLLALRDLQKKSGGITEFVPLPFVHMEAPMYLEGKARPGPTWHEVVLMHAISRLVLNPLIPNIQVSWVKLGSEGAAACLNAGANDLGGTLMNESISRAAGADIGQEFGPNEMDNLILSINRTPKQRTTLYKKPNSLQEKNSYHASNLLPLYNRPARALKIAS